MTYPICYLCNRIIYPADLRFKSWDTDEDSNTLRRVYIHTFHLGGLE